jgi:hypothetical protein
VQWGELLRFAHFSFAAPHLKHKIHAKWQVKAFHVPNNNGKGTNQID